MHIVALRELHLRKMRGLPILKEGYNSLVHSVIDSELVSYLRKDGGVHNFLSIMIAANNFTKLEWQCKCII